MKLLNVLQKIQQLEADHNEGDEHYNLCVHASVLFRNLIRDSEEIELFPSKVLVNETCGKTLITGEVTILIHDRV